VADVSLTAQLHGTWSPATTHCCRCGTASHWWQPSSHGVDITSSKALSGSQVTTQQQTVHNWNKLHFVNSFFFSFTWIWSLKLNLVVVMIFIALLICSSNSRHTKLGSKYTGRFYYLVTRSLAVSDVPHDTCGVQFSRDTKFCSLMHHCQGERFPRSNSLHNPSAWTPYDPHFFQIAISTLQ